MRVLSQDAFIRLKYFNVQVYPSSSSRDTPNNKHLSTEPIPQVVPML